MKSRIALGVAVSLVLCACSGSPDASSIPSNASPSNSSAVKGARLHPASLPAGAWTALTTPACPAGYSFFTAPNDTTWSPATQTGYVVGECENDNQLYKYTAEIYKVSHGSVTQLSAYNDQNNPGNFLQAVQTDSSTGNVYAVGYKTNPSGPTLVNVQYSTNGSNFQEINCPNPGNNQNFAYGVSVFSSTNVLIAGTYTNNVRGVLTGKTYLAHWNGSTCTLISSPNPNPTNDEFLAIGASSTANVWLVGLQGTNDYTPLCTLYNQTSSTFTQYTCPVSPGSPYDEQLNSVSVISSGQALADGYEGAGEGYATLNDYFHGSWSYEYPEPIEGRYSDILRDYGVLLIDATHGWSVGENQGLCQMGFWNGTQWNQFTCPQVTNAATNYFYGVSGNNSSALAGGVLSFDTPTGSGPVQVYIAMYGSGGGAWAKARHN